jgi:hypothetical protein
VSDAVVATPLKSNHKATIDPPDRVRIAWVADKFQAAKPEQLWDGLPTDCEYEVRPLGEALNMEFGCDAHFTSYVVFKDGVPVRRQPRLKKDQLQLVRERGFEVRMQVLIADIDTVPHEPITNEQIKDALAKLAGQSTIGLYTTRKGIRVVQPVTEARTPEQYEAGLPPWLDGLQKLLGDSWNVDFACCDWTRHFRMPNVVIDRKKTRPVIDLDRMTSVEMPIVEALPETKESVQPFIEIDPRTAPDNYTRCAKYIGRIQVPACGNGACESTLWNVAVHCHGFGLEEREAIELLQQWAASSKHGWTGQQVARKVSDALSSRTRRGFHLLEDRPARVEPEIRPMNGMDDLDDETEEMLRSVNAELLAPSDAGDFSRGESVSGVVSPPDWQNLLQKRRGGGFKPNHLNCQTVLYSMPGWQGQIAYDEFRDLIVWDRCPSQNWCKAWPRDKAVKRGQPWSDDHTIQMLQVFNRIGLDVGKEVFNQVLAVFAKRNAIHPVRQYLEGLGWDGTERLSCWLSNLLGVEDSVHSSLVGRWWMIQAVRRIMKPGAPAKYILTLEGTQDIGKSTALKMLAGPGWFCESKIDIGGKEGAMTLNGTWIMELAEGEILNRSSKEALKQFIGQTHDKYIPKYSNYSVETPRQTTFAMTVNPGESGYLSDQTGNVRFWPVLCTGVDFEGIERDRDQLWAEAMHCFRAGEVPEPRTAEDRALLAGEVEQRISLDPWEHEIESGLVGKTETAVFTILNEILGIDPKAHQKKDQNRVASFLPRLGFGASEKREHWQGHRVTVYRRSPEQAVGTGPAVQTTALTPSEQRDVRSLQALGWAETVLSDGRRVLTQAAEQPNQPDLDAV